MSIEQKGPRGFQLVDEGAAPGGPAAEGPMTFGTFLLSLATSALVHLGEGPPPGTQGPETGAPDPVPVNLPLAHQTIEILELLREKTDGNLDEDEARLFSGLLHDRRMRYGEAAARRNQ